MKANQSLVALLGVLAMLVVSCGGDEPAPAPARAATTPNNTTPTNASCGFSPFGAGGAGQYPYQTPYGAGAPFGNQWGPWTSPSYYPNQFNQGGFGLRGQIVGGSLTVYNLNGQLVTTLPAGQYQLQGNFATFNLNGQQCSATIGAGNGFLFPYWGQSALNSPWGVGGAGGFYNYPYAGGGGFWAGASFFSSGSVVNVGGNPYFWVY